VSKYAQETTESLLAISKNKLILIYEYRSLIIVYFLVKWLILLCSDPKFPNPPLHPTKKTLVEMLKEVALGEVVEYKIDQLILEIPGIKHPLLLTDLGNGLIMLYCKFLFK
jgi:hypothetical protein